MMKLATALSLLLLHALAGQSLQAQSGSSGSAGPAGTDYLIAFPPSDPEAVHQFHGLIVTSQVATNGTVVIPITPSSPLQEISEYETRPFAVSPDQPTFIPIPRSLEPLYSDESSRRVVHLTSRAPVTVSVMNARKQSSGVYRVLPTATWGKSYLPTTVGATWTNNLAITSQLLIIGSEDGTEVTIRPSAKTTFHQVGQQINITLDRGEVYLLQADSRQQVPGPRDLSGSSISATQPIGVVSGHVRAAIGLDPTASLSYRTNYGAWHATMELPEERWSAFYLSAPSRTGTGDRFRVVSRSDRTSLTATLYRGAETVTEQFQLEYRGEVIDISSISGRAIDGPVTWSATGPVSVAQIRPTGGDYTATAHSPALHHLSPVSEFSSFATVGLPYEIDGGVFSSFLLTIVAEGTSPELNVLIDGVPAEQYPGFSVERFGSNYTLLTVWISSGAHEIHSFNGVRFTARVRGSNGTVAATVLDYSAPGWVRAVELDRQAPLLSSTNRLSERRISVDVTDRTDSYFSGVAKIEVVDSPGWEVVSTTVPPDPDVDAMASFQVRSGYDPSGALTLRLVDRDGNSREVVAVENICFSTAYIDSSAMTLKTTRGTTLAETVFLRSNPCGDEATLTWIGWDISGSATPYLEDPVVGPLPLVIGPNGELPIEVRVKDTAPTGTYSTTLELVVDGKTKLMQLTLVVEPKTSVSSSEQAPLVIDLR